MKYPADPNDLDWGSLSEAQFKRAEKYYDTRPEDEISSEEYEVWVEGKKAKDFGNQKGQAVKYAQSLRASGLHAYAKVRRY